MAHNVAEAYEKRYAAGLRLREKLRGQRAHLGDLLRRVPHRSEQRYRAAYEEGFSYAMAVAAPIERRFTRDEPAS